MGFCTECVGMILHTSLQGNHTKQLLVGWGGVCLTQPGSTQVQLVFTGERTSASQRILAARSSSAPLPKGNETQLEKKAQDLCFPQPASAPAQSDARWEDIAVEREAPSEGKDLFFLDCLQPLQEKELLEHPGVALSPLRERNRARDPWRRKNQLPFPPAQNQQGLSCTSSDGCLMEDSENVDPQLKGCSTSLQSAARLRPNSEVLKSSSEEGHKESQAEPSVPLFSQDSEGYKVISHRFIRERGKPPLQKKPLWNRGSPSAGAFNPSQQFHYDSLFTEDSEGNRVIKH